MLGFKQLTPMNWTEPDPVNQHFARISPIAGPISMEGGDWAREFLDVSLADHVPDEVVDLFAIARGAMLYGWFFYPLFRIGEEQLYRVLESSARIRYSELGGEAARPGFKQMIAHLLERGAIAADQLERLGSGTPAPQLLLASKQRHRDDARVGARHPHDLRLRPRRPLSSLGLTRTTPWGRLAKAA